MRGAGPGAVVSVLKGGAELTPDPSSEWTRGPGPAPAQPSPPAVHKVGREKIINF